MGANKTKQNLRYSKTSERIHKISYKGLSKDQIKYIKAKDEHERLNKELNTFWRTAPRKKTGAVEWSKVSDAELDLFEYLSTQKEKAFIKMSKLENIIDIDSTLTVFMQMNLHSQSY